MEKDKYVSPETHVFLITALQLICASNLGTTIGDYDDEEDMFNEG